MACPRCGSENVEVITDVETQTQGFGVCRGILGYLCLGPIGIICGLCGMGEGTSHTKVYRMCRDCGAKFK